MLITAVVAAQLAGTLEVFDTSRLDARSNQPFTLAPTPPAREVAIAADRVVAYLPGDDFD